MLENSLFFEKHLGIVSPKTLGQHIGKRRGVVLLPWEYVNLEQASTKDGEASYSLVHECKLPEKFAFKLLNIDDERTFIGDKYSAQEKEDIDGTWVDKFDWNYNPLAFQVGFFDDFSKTIPEDAIPKAISSYLSAHKDVLDFPKHSILEKADNLEELVNYRVIHSNDTSVSYMISGLDTFRLHNYPLKTSKVHTQKDLRGMGHYHVTSQTPEQFYLSYLSGVAQEVLETIEPELFKDLKKRDFLQYVPKLEKEEESL